MSLILNWCLAPFDFSGKNSKLIFHINFLTCDCNQLLLFVFVFIFFCRFFSSHALFFFLPSFLPFFLSSLLCIVNGCMPSAGVTLTMACWLSVTSATNHHHHHLQQQQTLPWTCTRHICCHGCHNAPPTCPLLPPRPLFAIPPPPFPLSTHLPFPTLKTKSQ